MITVSGAIRCLAAPCVAGVLWGWLENLKPYVVVPRVLGEWIIPILILVLSLGALGNGSARAGATVAMVRATERRMMFFWAMSTERNTSFFSDGSIVDTRAEVE